MTDTDQDQEHHATEFREPAQRIWDAALPATERHPILMLRGIQVPGLRLDGSGSLLMPLRDSARKIQNVAFIRVVGKMQFLHDFVRGAYFGIEGERDVIYVVRGLSRGAHYYRSTGNSVAVVVDEESIEIVAEVMRHRYPHAKIVMATDIDGAQSSFNQAEVAPPTFNRRVGPPELNSEPEGSATERAQPPGRVEFDAEVEGYAANVTARTAEQNGDSAAAAGRAAEDTVDERSDAPRASREPLEGLSQAPARCCRTSDANALLKPESEEAQLLLKWIERKRVAEFTQTTALRYGPNSLRCAPLAKLALRELVRSG
jgi:hypothetical protein